MKEIPASDVDLFTDEALADPYPLYRELRDLGPVVELTQNGMYAFPRYRQVREASGNWEVFSSAKGVMMNDQINSALEGVTLCSDPPEHTQMRSVLGRPLRPERLRELTPRIEEEAERVVERLVRQGSFDAATELAEHLPLTIVSEQVGLGDAGRARMLEWAAATFDAQGPMNQRTRDSFPQLDEMVAFALSDATRDTLRADGWAAQLYTAAEQGDLPVEKCPFMMIDYIAPSLDTTIYAISSAIHLFARHPEQWNVLREDHSLIPHAINEALRLESPVQRFTRVLTEDYDVEGYTLPAGSRVVLLYGAANRDERKYPDPDRFDVRRKPSDHLAFGRGEHVCIGMNLARIEMRALFEALLPRVGRFELLESELALNNTLRGLGSLKVRVS
ncbi:cytochrome P450 (plasmid) [Streptomyces sp. NBC_01471]|uniref:cytochrome P450 n=1 Tax=Streptomyces sp. NBC_01471 TaxID=2903879 RepID=UPI003252EFC7